LKAHNNRLLAEVGERGKGKGERFGIFLSPLTFSLFPPLAKVFFARGLMLCPYPYISFT